MHSNRAKKSPTDDACLVIRNPRAKSLPTRKRISPPCHRLFGARALIGNERRPADRLLSAQWTRQDAPILRIHARFRAPTPNSDALEALRQAFRFHFACTVANACDTLAR